MTMLMDHRRFASGVLIVIAVMVGLLALLLTVGGRAVAIPGLLAGAGIAAADVILLVRSIDRFSRQLGGAGSRALHGMLMARFFAVAMVVGIVICARGVSVIGVVVGFMLLPAAIFVVGAYAIRQEAHGARARRLDASAR